MLWLKSRCVSTSQLMHYWVCCVEGFVRSSVVRGSMWRQAGPKSTPTAVPMPAKTHTWTAWHLLLSCHVATTALQEIMRPLGFEVRYSDTPRKVWVDTCLVQSGGGAVILIFNSFIPVRKHWAGLTSQMKTVQLRRKSRKVIACVVGQIVAEGSWEDWWWTPTFTVCL